MLFIYVRFYYHRMQKKKGNKSCFTLLHPREKSVVGLIRMIDKIFTNRIGKYLLNNITTRSSSFSCVIFSFTYHRSCWYSIPFKPECDKR